jgi:hypothetical protein
MPIGDPAPITGVEVDTAITSLRNNKALGESWLSPELLKSAQAPTLATTIAKLFNKISHTVAPERWNTLRVTSILKKGPPEDPTNYRGISIMSTLPKLYA